MDVVTLAAAKAAVLSRPGRDKVRSQPWPALGPVFAKASKAAMGTGRLNVVCGPSDSITESYQATTMPDRGWVNQCAQITRRGLGLSATGGRGFIAAQPGSTSITPWPIVRSAGNAVDNSMGPNKNAALLSAGQTLTCSLVGTSADIMWKANTGSFTWAVDGGSATAVSGGVGRDGALQRVTLGAAGAHTLVITCVSPCYIDGVVEYNGDETTGVLFHNIGHSGWHSGSWLSNPGVPTWASTAVWPNAISALTPDLMVGMLMTNDESISTGITAAQYKTNWQTLITGLRQASGMSTVPFLLVAPYRRGDADYSAIHPSYVAKLREIEAADPSVIVLDMSARMPAADATNTFGLYSSDKIHPVDAGMWLIAQAVSDLLMPQ